MKRIILFIFVLVMIFAGCGKANEGGSETNGADNEEAIAAAVEAEKEALIKETVADAEQKAAMYDYEGAIAALQGIDSEEASSKIEEYKQAEGSLTEYTPEQVTHVFFHSLIVDPDRGFSMTGEHSHDVMTPNYCQWMITVDEFNETIKEMYERGFVMVDIKELYEEQDGKYVPKNIKLPEGKIPFVLSLDDTSYYHAYDGRGFASKLLINSEGKVVNEYYDADGNRSEGDYDCIPILDTFVEEHPDFSYKGAKGIIALTGYDGILGYRTDRDYVDRENLTSEQERWLSDHPGFDEEALEKEREEAKKVCDKIKENGWRFGSHTWGHMRIGDADMERVVTDTTKWKERVETLTGETDIIVFAHGQDLAEASDYEDSEKFKYLKENGFNVYMPVDSTKYTTEIKDSFVHQGRRNIDGYRLWEAIYGGKDRLEDLIDCEKVWDEKRPSDDSFYDLS